MPVEINELTVRAKVRDEQNDGNCGDGQSRDAKNRPRNGAMGDKSAIRQSADLAAELLKRQKER